MSENQRLKRKVSISFLIYDQFDEHDVECARKGTSLNSAIWSALQAIRNRLKYCSDDVSESEQKFLEELRSELGHAYIEEEC